MMQTRTAFNDNREAKIANVTITLTDADGNSLADVYGNRLPQFSPMQTVTTASQMCARAKR